MSVNRDDFTFVCEDGEDFRWAIISHKRISACWARVIVFKSGLIGVTKGAPTLNTIRKINAFRDLMIIVADEAGTITRAKEAS